MKLVSKLNYFDLYESVRSVIFENLLHKHHYVRKNALACIISVLNNFGIDSLPNEIVPTLKKMIEEDSDQSVVRSAYITLAAIDSDESLDITKTLLQKQEISEIGEFLLLSIVKNLKNIAKQSNSSDKSKIIKLLIDLTQCKLNSILFELSYSLLEISSSTGVVKQAVTLLSNLLNDLNDNTIITIILNKLMSLKHKHKKILEENIVSYASILNKSDLTQNLKSNLLTLIIELFNESNINPVMNILKHVYTSLKSKSNNESTYIEFSFRIIDCMMSGLRKYNNVVFTEFKKFLIDKICQFNLNSQYKEEYCSFIKELFFYNKDDSSELYSELQRVFENVSNHEMQIMCLNLLSEYHLFDKNSLKSTFELIERLVGTEELILKDSSEMERNDKKENTFKTVTKTVVLKDGSYGTETVKLNTVEIKEKNYLRENLLTKNYFFSSAVVVSITKIFFYFVNNSKFNDDFNKYYFACLNLLSNIIKIESPYVFKDENNVERISICFDLVLKNEYSDFLSIVKESQQIFDANFLSHVKSNSKNEDFTKNETNKLPGSNFIFKQLNNFDKENFGIVDEDDEETIKLSQELDQLLTQDKDSNTNTVEILTGTEDPLFIEAVINKFTYDIVIDFYVKNRSKHEFQNILFEIFVPKNLTIIEKPLVLNLKSGEQAQTRMSLKFSTSCSCYLFGEISYNNIRGATGSLNLSGIFINLLETHKSECSESYFRKKWLQYNWENKTMIVFKGTSFKELISNFSSKLNTTLVFPTSNEEIDEESTFLVANLFTKSKLNEDALINISVEKMENKIIGTAIIRSNIKEFADSQADRIVTLIK